LQLGSSLELSEKFERICVDYRADLRHEITQLQMCAMAIYIIDDDLALPAGNEKEADMIASCHSSCDWHVTFELPIVTSSVTN
jgi:hypothetical protein